MGYVSSMEGISLEFELGGVTLPETNIAGWKIHHCDGIYQERCGFSWAMLPVSFRKGNSKFA